MNQNLSHFPINYDYARKQFLSGLSNRSDWQIGKWRIPSAVDVDLFVDHAYLAPLKSFEKLFVIVSGVHGLEAYAGSAVQRLFLNEILPTIKLNHIGVFLVHCMNPYGFKYHRRCTENEVNLNRNCSSKLDLYKTKNSESLNLCDQYIPKKPVDSLTSTLINKIQNQQILIDNFIKTVGLGQFESEKGLEFGGFGPEPQVRALTERLKELMPSYKDVILLDLHTGLGEKNCLHLLGDDSPGSIDPSLCNELFDPARDHKIYQFTPSHSEGFYPTFGTLNSLFPELALKSQRICALTMEFATLGHSPDNQVDGLNRWMLEHQGNHYGYVSPDLEHKIRSMYLEKFFPATNEWKNNVLNLSRQLLQTVMSRSQAL